MHIHTLLRLLVFLFSLNVATGCFAGCLSVPFPIGPETREALFHSFRTEMAAAFGTKKFDTATPGTLIAETEEFRIRRSRPLIGIPPQLPDPKFKKQRLTYYASYRETGSVCVSVESQVYNRRDRTWHTVRSDGRLEQRVLEPVMTHMLRNRPFWVLGRLTGTINNAPAHLNGGTHVRVSSAQIIHNDIKKLQLNLVTVEEQIFTHTIPFLGDTSTVFSLLKHILHRFACEDPLADVPEQYHFFTAYARHGELMDGMVPAQVMVALGRPEQIIRTSDSRRTWHYPDSTGYPSLVFENGELQLQH